MGKIKLGGRPAIVDYTGGSNGGSNGGTDMLAKIKDFIKNNKKVLLIGGIVVLVLWMK